MRSAAGDPGPTLMQLYPPLAPALHAWASLRLAAERHRIAPEDLTQEIWLRAVELFDRWDPRRGPFRPWLFAVAKMVLLEVRRRLRRIRVQPGAPGTTTNVHALEQVPHEITSISRRLARDEQVRAFVDRLDGLDPLERQTVLHCGIEGMPLAEAATRLGEAMATTAKRWQRLRARMVGWAAPLGMVDD